MNVGERIRERRKAIGYTQKELAEKSGVAIVSVQQYERGVRQPRLEQLQRIAESLETTIDYFLSGGDEVTQIHLANGVHIYRNYFVPFKVTELFLEHPSSDSCDILYQDEYVIISADKDSPITDEEFKKILDVYAPFREKKTREDAEFLIRVKEGEFHTRMNTAFFRLNFSGKQEAVKRIEELTEIPRYRAETAPESTLNLNEGSSTTLPSDAPETPPEGE